MVLLHSSKDHLINMYVLEASKMRVNTSEFKGTYRDCRKSTGNKLGYWYT